MLEQMMLREQFETLLDQQQVALGHYETAAKTAGQKNREYFAQLCRDKKRHIQLTQRLIEIVE